MVTIFLFLANQLYITDALRTNFIRYLSQRYKVVVFLPEVYHSENTRYYSSSTVIYEYIVEPPGKFWLLFNELLRNELITRFADNPSVLWRNRRTTNPRRLLLRRLRKVLPTNFLTPRLFTWLESRLAPGYSLFQGYVRKYQPNFVLTPTPGFTTLEAGGIVWAKRAKIPSVGYNFSWDNLSAYPRHIRTTNYLMTWSERLKEEAVLLHGYNPNTVFVTGALRFDHYFLPMTKEINRQDFLLSKNLDPTRKTIFFAAKSHGTFHQDFIEAFIKWQQADHFSEPLNLFVRTHPVDQIHDYQKFLNVPYVHIEMGGKANQVDYSSGHKTEMDEEDLENTRLTLKHCDICVSLASTMSIEAMVFDKPVINIGFVPEFSEILKFDHYRPIVEHGASRVAHSLEEVYGLIELYLKDPSLDRQNRVWAARYVMGPTDGYSYKRIVDFVEIIVSQA